MQYSFCAWTTSMVLVLIYKHWDVINGNLTSIGIAVGMNGLIVSVHSPITSQLGGVSAGNVAVTRLDLICLQSLAVFHPWVCAWNTCVAWVWCFWFLFDIVCRCYWHTLTSKCDLITPPKDYGIFQTIEYSNWLITWFRMWHSCLVRVKLIIHDHVLYILDMSW